MKTNISTELAEKIKSGEMAIYPDGTREQMQMVLDELFPEDPFSVSSTYQHFLYRAHRTDAGCWGVTKKEGSRMPAIMLSTLITNEEDITEDDFPMDDYSDIWNDLPRIMMIIIFSIITLLALLTIVLFTIKNPS